MQGDTRQGTLEGVPRRTRRASIPTLPRRLVVEAEISLLRVALALVGRLPQRCSPVVGAAEGAAALLLWGGKVQGAEAAAAALLRVGTDRAVLVALTVTTTVTVTAGAVGGTAAAGGTALGTRPTTA